MDIFSHSQAILLPALLTGALFMAVLGCIAAGSGFFAKAIQWLRKDPLVRVLLIVGLLSTGPITSRSKNGAPSRSAQTTQPADIIPPFVCNEARTNGVTMVEPTTNAVVSQACLLHGASEAGEWMESAKPFFRWGTNDIRRLYASPGCLSFGTKRHPYLGDTLPNGTPAESLVVLRTPLGIVPEANWHLLEGTGVVSRFWHDALPGGGRVFTWENALLDRLSDCPATIQAELRPNGDFVYRYDFSHSAPTNAFLVGAQKGSAAVEVLRIGNAETNSAIVYRLDGDTATNGVPIADLFATAPLLELRWKNTSGLGDLTGDTDGDGLTDWDEVFLHGTNPEFADTDGDGASDGAEIAWCDNPLDANENGDGIPDGVSAADWAANPLWATNSVDGGNVTITLNEAIPSGATATLVLGSLSIPLRNAASMDFRLPVGETIQGRLFSRGVDAVKLSISPRDQPESPALLRSGGELAAPRLRDDPRGVLDGNSSTGTFRIAVPEVRICNLDGTRAVSECVHDSEGVREYMVQFLPNDWGLSLDDVRLDGFERVGDDRLRLSVGGDAYDDAMGRVSLWKYLDYGIVEDTVLLWRCNLGADEPFPVRIDMNPDAGSTFPYKSVVPRHSTSPAERPTVPCRLEFTNALDHAATVHLSGHRIRFEPGSTTTLAVTVPAFTSHFCFDISGETESITTNDAWIIARRQDAEGVVCASNSLTVVWVDSISIRTTQDAAFSSDNASAIKPIPALLGARYYEIPYGRSGFGYVVEIRGIVHPSDFPLDIPFARDYIDVWQAADSPDAGFAITHSATNAVRRPPPGNDDPPSVCQSRHPSTSGAIYDFDAPGFVAADLGSQPPGIVYYMRQNFLQYAYIGGKRCSNDFAWWVRTTARTGGPNYLHPTEIWSRPEHPHDNAAGTGSTNMGIDE